MFLPQSASLLEPEWQETDGDPEERTQLRKRLPKNSEAGRVLTGVSSLAACDPMTRPVLTCDKRVQIISIMLLAPQMRTSAKSSQTKFGAFLAANTTRLSTSTASSGTCAREPRRKFPTARNPQEIWGRLVSSYLVNVDNR